MGGCEEIMIKSVLRPLDVGIATHGTARTASIRFSTSFLFFSLASIHSGKYCSLVISAVMNLTRSSLSLIPDALRGASKVSGQSCNSARALQAILRSKHSRLGHLIRLEIAMWKLGHGSSENDVPNLDALHFRVTIRGRLGTLMRDDHLCDVPAHA